MFTLKIQQRIFTAPDSEGASHLDEVIDVWISSVQQVRRHAGSPTSVDQFRHWEPGDLELFTVTDAGKDGDGTYLEAVTTERTRWFLVDRAWLLGPDGQTIERLA